MSSQSVDYSETINHHLIHLFNKWAMLACESQAYFSLLSLIYEWNSFFFLLYYLSLGIIQAQFITLIISYYHPNVEFEFLYVMLMVELLQGYAKKISFEFANERPIQSVHQTDGWAIDRRSSIQMFPRASIFSSDGVVRAPNTQRRLPTSTFSDIVLSIWADPLSLLLILVIASLTEPLCTVGKF